MSSPLVPRDPQSVALFRLDRAILPQYLTRDQVHELVAKGCRRDRDRYFTRVAFETGGRVSELLGLVRSDVDISNRQIRLRTLKRRTDRRRKEVELARWIPVSHSLCADLANWFLNPPSRISSRKIVTLDSRKAESLLERTAELRIFPFSRQAAFKIIRTAGRRAGLVARGGREISPHILRHSFAMNCITQGVPINVVKELLGHASITNTMLYLKTDPAEAREFLSKVQF
jgi:integrase/recombinase XerD